VNPDGVKRAPVARSVVDLINERLDDILLFFYVNYYGCKSLINLIIFDLIRVDYLLLIIDYCLPTLFFSYLIIINNL
jgi:hypothetical protein